MSVGPRIAALACPLLLIACSSPTSTTGSSASNAAASSASSAQKKPAAAPRPQKALTVTVDGKAIPMVAALARKRADGAQEISVFSVPQDCSLLEHDGHEMSPGEFNVTLGQRLAPDGAITTVVASSWYEGMTRSDLNVPTKTTGEWAPGKPFGVDVDFTSDSAGANKTALVAKGTIDALVCPDEAPRADSPAPKLPEPMKATLEIAKKSLPIRSAGLKKDGERVDLILSTGGDACSWKEAKGELMITFAYQHAKDDAPWQATLGGTLPSASMDQTFDKKKVKITPRPDAPGAYELQAELEVVKYPVKISGTVDAKLCP